MKCPPLLLLLLLAAGPFDVASAESQPKGVIAQTTEDGHPVIWKFEDELPPETERKTLPWLTVISWKYDGHSRNGLPSPDINRQMVAVEDALRLKVEAAPTCRHIYSRTGNNLKELVYQINDRQSFTSRLNEALRGEPRYPIEITFYEDPEWKDFQKLLDASHRSKPKAD